MINREMQKAVVEMIFVEGIDRKLESKLYYVFLTICKS